MKLLYEDNEIAVFSNYEYDKEFLERLSDYYKKRKNKIINFFKLLDFRKTNIYLYSTREEYVEYMKNNNIYVSSYGIGRCLNGDIHYVITENDLKEFQKVGYKIASIVHELVHLIYYEKVNQERCILIDEGLAHLLSGQKSLLENNNEKYEKWLQEKIYSKELPKFEYLIEHGDFYGKFVDTKTERYNGYDIGYAFVRYIIDTYNEDEKRKVLIEQDIVEVEKYYNDFKEYIESKR